MRHDAATAWMSTRDAAARLGCAERTVLMYLERGELKGDRPGKSWRVAAASVDKKAAALGRSSPPPVASPTTSPPTVVPAISSAPDVPPEADAAVPERRGRARGAPAADGTPKDYSFRDLAALRELSDLAASVQRAVHGLGDKLPAGAARASLDAALSAAQHGAAGYHAYSPSDKARLYARAREQVAMAAAALWILADSSEGRAEGLRLVAASYERSARGLGGLMKRAAGKSHGA